MEPRGNSDDLLQLACELYLLWRESAKYQQNAEVRSRLELATKEMSRHCRRLQTASRRYVVAVVGLGNVGKSTLLNALFGAELAPRRNGPCTSAPIEFVYQKELRVVVHQRGRADRLRWRCETLHDVQLRLASLSDEAGELAATSFDKIVVELPHPLLADGLVLSDTPGLGAVQFGDQAGKHEQSLKTYLEGDVSQVFWVVLADQGIGKRESQACNDWFGDVCDDVVVTGCEEWSESDRNGFRRRYAGRFNGRSMRFHFVSGKLGLDARRSGDESELEASGVPKLVERIRELSQPEARSAGIHASIVHLTEDVCDWIGEYRDRRGLPLRGPWRPDSWQRWLGFGSKNPFKAPIASLLRRFHA